MMVSCLLRRCQIKKHVDSFISLSHTVEKKQSKQQTCNLLIKMCVALVHKNQLLSVCLLQVFCICFTPLKKNSHFPFTDFWSICPGP